ncbi:RNase P/MRP, p29 subunit [Sodiomyces alkalinus F11]|uniref:Ribonuclease P protein subunit n=1 Tax=Sodiomyces alkalinus (strain CBS 110278 / VKM F-3762 / F11) TaxID=1314773 RepID=A0A3N2Q5B4_SODAK|nr:RNase P/MRP, p29 subunit [Sodiomyces alkalinus F11]ROT41887.1 RNase P/MRP, p29 subunit [Sodiomyces alkalinus F11]
MAQPPSTTKSLLARAHSPDSASRIFDDKIQYRSFYLRPSSPPPPDAREARRKARRDRALTRSKQKPAPLSARARRRLGLYDLPRDRQRYALYEPLLGLWQGYVRELLGNELYTGGQAAAAKLSAGEMHGAEVEVVRSSCPSRVGIRGIVVKDARFVFEIVTPRDRVKVVPKEGTMFRVEVLLEDPPELRGEGQNQGQQGREGQEQKMPESAVPGDDATTTRTSRPRKFVFEILGDQFLHRGADRANKKFKTHFLKNV